ncbi:YceD family protein [Sphingomonas cavernae]|uniref:DUF177 domain-containing protein n=1 Tax=Sphingomonas cavernae TaxID=2320861 RepID=A0A418WR14_9SPHN|nr:YceD family protein [Sphingomonas cavernae]RJF93599.1 DUF177 domain-containing protein [Sphingomonas cavernae]
MSAPAPEFSRVVRIDTIGDSPRTIAVAADDAERTALARRFGLIAIAHLEGNAALVRVAGGISARGRIAAQVEQSCVATGESVPAEIDEPFALKFVTVSGDVPADEVELSEGELDIVEFDGQAVDLGEALAQTLALALDPFPRSADADATLKAAGVMSEDEAGPFGALAALKQTLEKKPPR